MYLSFIVLLLNALWRIRFEGGGFVEKPYSPSFVRICLQASGYFYDLPVVECRIFPDEILDQIEMSERAVTVGIPEALNKRLREGEPKILLLGSVGPESLQALVLSLAKRSFRGKIDVVDISPTTIALIQAYREYFNWEKCYGIKVTTMCMDINQMSYPQLLDEPRLVDSDANFASQLIRLDGTYDFILADVLAHYLTDQQMIDGFRRAVNWGLKPDGLALVREMGEIENIQAAERTVSSEELTQLDGNLTEFQSWLKRNFRVEVDLETIRRARTTPYPDPVHKPRGLWLDTFMTGVMISLHPKGQNPLELVFDELIVPKSCVDGAGRSNGRIFGTYMFAYRQAGIPAIANVG